DYSFDTVSFFSINPAAQAALAAAAADISAVITSSLAPIASQSFVGTYGITSVHADWELQITNPSTGSVTTIDTFSLPSDTFRVFVGARTFDGLVVGRGG